MRPFPDADHPAAPYPGSRPACSFVHVDGVGHPLVRTGAGWSVDGQGDLDEWLRSRGVPGLAGRRPVLAYGSNANPSKITWLRSALGLPGPVVVLRVATSGLAAVWAAGLRVVDDQRPATLAAAPGIAEQHAVWLATDEQLAVLDVCEGRGSRYDLAVLRTGSVRDEGGRAVTEVLTYVGRAAIRMPLLVDGSPVRCADVGQSAASALDGVPAAGHGLDVDVLDPGVPVEFRA